jgi:glycosyltransferase involved in cell wall biosynthesis
VTPRKILQITSYPPPRAGWGVRVEFLKKHLEANGHECVVLNLGRSRFTPSPEYETVLGGVDYVKKVWRFSRRGFLVHMHLNGESPKGFVLTLLAQFINLVHARRCVITFHAGVNQPYFPRPKWPVLLPMYKLIFGIPRTIVCNSEAVRQKIAEYGVPLSKIHAIPAFSTQYLELRPVALPDAAEAFYAEYPEAIFTYVRIRDGFYLDTLIEGFALLAKARPRAGLVLNGVSGDVDPGLWADVEARIARHGLRDRVCVIDDLDHDQFLVALTRSSLYLRTPTTDGVASSVLESLALKVPVVAAQNGTRPDGVVCYTADDPVSLADAVADTLDRRKAIAASLPAVVIRDTVSEENALLTR